MWTSSEFKRVFAQNVSVSDRNFVLLASANVSGYPRLGLAVAKKHVKRAVDRNRIKRIIREAFRLHQQRTGQMDIVVLVKRGIALDDNAVLRQSLEMLWRKLLKKCAQSSLA